MQPYKQVDLIYEKRERNCLKQRETSKGFSRLMQVSLRLGINHVTPHSLHREWVKVEFRMHSTVVHCETFYY